MNLREQASSNLPIFYSPGVVTLSAEHICLLGELARQVTAAHPFPGQVQLVLTDDSYIRRLNVAYRGKDCATDVLSFDLGPPFTLEEAATTCEIYISAERARAQAARRDVAEIEELARLLVHGLLHLAGYDHDTPEKLLLMERETDLFLREANLLNSASTF